MFHTLTHDTVHEPHRNTPHHRSSYHIHFRKYTFSNKTHYTTFHFNYHYLEPLYSSRYTPPTAHYQLFNTACVHHYIRQCCSPRIRLLYKLHFTVVDHMVLHTIYVRLQPRVAGVYDGLNTSRHKYIIQAPDHISHGFTHMQRRFAINMDAVDVVRSVDKRQQTIHLMRKRYNKCAN